MSKSDSVYHKSIDSQIAVDIETSQRDMTNLQRELDEQRKLKAMKAEYEMVAKQINQYQPQEFVLARISSLEAEMKDLESKSNSEEIILKQKQLHALVSMI